MQHYTQMPGVLRQGYPVYQSQNPESTKTRAYLFFGSGAQAWLVGNNYSIAAAHIHSKTSKAVPLPNLAAPSAWSEYDGGKFTVKAGITVRCADAGPGFKYVLAKGECAATTTSSTTTTTTLRPSGGRCGSAKECTSNTCNSGRCVEGRQAGAVSESPIIAASPRFSKWCQNNLI